MLLRVLLGVFFIAHGLVHVAIWAPKYDPEKAAFDASHSWLLGDQRPLARVLAFSAATILIVAGIVLLAQGGWWPIVVVGLSVSTALLLLYFNPWYLSILAVNVALVVGIAFMDWPRRRPWELERGGGELRSPRERRRRSPLDLGGVSEEPVATAFDADELGSRDAGRRTGGEPIRRERVVVPGVDDQRRNGDLLEGEPVRSWARTRQWRVTPKPFDALCGWSILFPGRRFTIGGTVAVPRMPLWRGCGGRVASGCR